MKNLFFIVILLMFHVVSFANIAPTSSAYVSELYFDENDNWTIELYFTYYDAEMDTGYVMITPTDTAFFKKFPDETHIVLLTISDLSNPINISRAGGLVRFENWFDEMYWNLAYPIVFGNYPNSKVNAPFIGQSLVSVLGNIVKDTASSLGILRDPAQGIVIGHIYDSVGIPLPYIRVQTYGVEARTMWPDENGFFTDTLYAKNYGIFIYNGNPNKIYSGGFAIEPDSTTIHDIYLPVSAEIKFSGNCYLEGTDDHSGTRIFLTPQCPFALNDTIITDMNGYFSKTIPVGHYYLRYSHENFLPFFTYSFIDVFFEHLMNDVYLEEGNVHEITDSIVSGRWINDYPYWIFNNINIKENDSLIIEPGVQIIFKRNRQWDVFGKLLALGNIEDSIMIQADISKEWGPLNFWNETSSDSKLKYLDINLQENINFFNSSPSVEKSLFFGNGDLCFLSASSPHVNECYFDFGSSLSCKDSSSPLITKNFITNPGSSGIYCLDQSTPKIFNNNFWNQWVGIYFDEESKPDVNNNIFYSMSPGIWEHRYESDYYNIRNNLFYDCEVPVWWYFGYLEGFGILDTTNINGDTCDIYFNLFMDPLFTNPETGDFSLSSESPCIDAGYPLFEYDPDSTIADIGALYFDQTGVFIHNRKNSKPDISLYHYPNPASDFVNFVIEGNDLRGLNTAKIKIYDISGKQVGELPCPFLDKGFGKKIYRYHFEKENLNNSGTYIYTFEADGLVLLTKKLILAK